MPRTVDDFGGIWSRRWRSQRMASCSALSIPTAGRTPQWPLDRRWLLTYGTPAPLDPPLKLGRWRNILTKKVGDPIR